MSQAAIELLSASTSEPEALMAVMSSLKVTRNSTVRSHGRLNDFDIVEPGKLADAVARSSGEAIRKAGLVRVLRR